MTSADQPAPIRPGRTGRAAQREAFVDARAGTFDDAALSDAMATLLTEAPAPKARGRKATKAAAAAPGTAKAFPTGDVRRWVPIGPSVVRAKEGRRFARASGRIRDLQVSADGRRAYAATAKGGLWYTDTAGALWSPVGGWADRPLVKGGVGNAQACGCLLVAFGDPASPDPAALDYVMVGTGELQGFSRPPIRPALTGKGVLAARGPASSAGAGGDPWEPQSGIALLEGLGCFSLARDPAAEAGKPDAPRKDRVVVATSAGLFLGARQPAGPPHNGEFAWTLLPALGAFFGLPAGAQPIVTAVMWLARGADPKGRIVVALAKDLEAADPAVFPVARSGVAFSDDLGATFTWVTGLDPTAAGAEPGIGRMSVANPAADRVYVLGERHTAAAPPDTDKASVWQIPAMAGATPTATLLTGVPSIWTRSSATGKNQRDYDQALAAEVVGGVDRVYLGGNFGSSGTASVWIFDVDGVTKALKPVTGVSRTGTLHPPVGDGAPEDGFVGDDIHPDVQVIRLAGTVPDRQVWVGCDGGIFVSTQNGRVSTYGARVTGLAALEVNFVAAHPTSSHYGAIGTQDNGRHSRTGDMVWEDTMGGDGGGVTFHPNLSHVILSQFTRAAWETSPDVTFRDPLTNSGGFDAAKRKREEDASAFYSGPASVPLSALVGRIAVGTNRVWVTDDVGSGARNTWKALPYPSGAPSNPRPGGDDTVPLFGVPGGAPLPPASGVPLGSVLTTKWVLADPLGLPELLVMFEKGLVRWSEKPAGTWATELLVAPAGKKIATVDAPDPVKSMLSDVAPIPGTHDFYVTTVGDPATTATDTCLFFDDATKKFLPTDLRKRLPVVAPATDPPLDPAYSVVVDPTDNKQVYVGTVTGVWHGVRTPGTAPHAWTPLVNGLPQAAVQDLNIWVDPAGLASSPRLLRAAVQSRGVWEVDLKAPTEPRRTYIKVHARDDRRRIPTPMANPRQPPAAAAVSAVVSRDIMVRPKAAPVKAPKWMGVVIEAATVPDYQLWTFQTAFRWLFPSVHPDGRWGEAFGNLVELHRSRLGLPAVPAVANPHQAIDQALWEKVVGKNSGGSVVGGVRVTAAGQVTSAAGDPLAVYRAPWQTSVSPNAVATEIDLLETVVMRNGLGDVSKVFTEKCTVDVLIHHRDTRPLAANDAFVLLLWREKLLSATLLGTDVKGIPAYVTALLGGGAVPATPAGWTLGTTGPRGLDRLTVPLDARLPRAVSVDVDLSGVPNGHQLMVLAVVGSSVDACAVAPAGPLPALVTPEELARRWPYAAVRMVTMDKRPT